MSAYLVWPDSANILVAAKAKAVLHGIPAVPLVFLLVAISAISNSI